MLQNILVLVVFFHQTLSSSSGYFEEGRFVDIIKSGEEIQIQTKNIATLGRSAELGDFYDATTDRFPGISIFSKTCPNLTIQSVDNPYSDLEYIRTETVSEKISAMNIQAEVAVSVFFGLIPVYKGSSKYLKEDKKKYDSAKISFVYTVLTKTEVLKLFSDDCKTTMDLDLLDMIDATHVVVGIDWGAAVVCSLEETSTDSSTKTEVEGMLGDALKGIADGTGFDAGKIESSHTFSIQFHGDVTPDVLPQTFNDSIKFIREIPDLVSKVNDGKGKKMNYILIPLEAIRKVMNMTRPNAKIFEGMSPSDLKKAINLYQDLINSELIIKDVYHEIQSYQDLAADDFSKIEGLKSDFDAFAAEIKNNVTNSIVDIRSGRGSRKMLNRILSEHSNSNFTFDNISKSVGVFNQTIAKIKAWNVLLDKARYLDRNFDQILINNYKNEIRIISIDLDYLNVSKKVFDRVIGLLNGDNDGIPYYVRNVYVRDSGAIVNAYKEGNIIATYDLTVDKKNYLLIKDANGLVTLMDAETYVQIKTFQLPDIKDSMIASVGNMFYKIDVLAGDIYSTGIENLLNYTQIYWVKEGSFPPETDLSFNNIAYNKTEFFFATKSGILYKFDTRLRTVIKAAELTPNGTYTSMLKHKTDIYLHKETNLYRFDGDSIFEISTDRYGKRQNCGLIMIKNRICRIGGNLTETEDKPVTCYDPTNGSWSVFVNTQLGLNVGRQKPGIGFTNAGAIIIGGEIVHADSSVPNNWSNYLQLVDLNLRILKYIPSSFPNGLTSPQAITFYY